MYSNKKNVFFITLFSLMLSSCGVKHKDQLFDYLPVKFKSEDKKISLIDYDGNIVAEEEFASTSQILPINDVITEINIEGKVKYWVLDDKKIKPLIDQEFNSGTPFYEDAAIVRDDQGILSLINKKGEPLIANLSKINNYQVQRVGILSDGLIRFKTDEGKWGYLNKKGEVILKPIYTKCENFVNDLARVMLDNTTFNIINKKGEILFKGDEETTYFPVSNNYIEFGKRTSDNKIYYGLNDLKGKKLIKDNKYTMMSLLTSEMLAVKNEDREWGVININQEIVGDLRFKFENAPYISKSGYIVANSDRKVKLYNKKGELVKSFDEYEYLIPISANRLIAGRKNDKVDILNEEGKEISKDSYFITTNMRLFNIFGGSFISFSPYETPEIIMNSFTIESKYFDFDKIFNNGIIEVTLDNIAGIGKYDNIEKVLSTFPYVVYQGINNLNNNDNYSYGFFVASNKKSNETIKPQFDNSNPNAAATVDTAAAGTMNTGEYVSQQNTKYSFLSEYNSTYITYKTSNLGGALFAYTFGFDQGLKTPILGQDPIFTNQSRVIDYGLNLNAHLSVLKIEFNLGIIDKSLFKKKIVEKLISAGWEKSNNENNFFNRVNQNTLYLNEYGIVFYFN